MHSPIISGTIYILSMSCISGDEVQVAIHRREDIVGWLKSLDHEGSNWTVVNHVYDGNPMKDADAKILETIDLTDEIMEEYGNRSE